MDRLLIKVMYGRLNFNIERIHGFVSTMGHHKERKITNDYKRPFGVNYGPYKPFLNADFSK